MPRRNPPPVDPLPVSDATGLALVARWAVGIVELVGVGLCVPVVILVVGTPIVLAVRALIAVAGGW